MPLIIKEDSKQLTKRQIKVPNKLVNKIQANLNLFGKYKKTKGYKRANSIVDSDYNKRSDRKDKIHNNDKTISFSDAKRIEHDLQHGSQNPYDLSNILIGASNKVGDNSINMKDWVHDTLRKLRTSVKKVQAVPEVPKLEKPKQIDNKKPQTIQMGKATITTLENKQYLKEDDDWHPYFDAMMQPADILFDFISSKTPKQQWDLIEPSQYQKALQEFTQYGQFVRFPEKYIYNWMNLIMKNTAKLRANGELYGKEMYPPTYELQDIAEQYPQFFEKAIAEYGEISDDNCYDILDYIGFYDWAELPDGSIGASDVGTSTLEKIIWEYRENLPPEKVIVIINKALDVAHCQGDLASAFIKGGRKTLSQISESINKKKTKKKIIVTEEQLLYLKEYHTQTVFNFDDEGEPYYRKNNWEHYVDYLEQYGTYGQLPPSEWDIYDIRQAIDKAKENIDIEDDEDEIDIEIVRYQFETMVNEAIQDEDYMYYWFTPEMADIFMLDMLPKIQNNETTVEKYIAEEQDIFNWNLDDFANALNVDGYKHLMEEVTESFFERGDENGMPDSLEFDDRGLIYAEREITIPSFNKPEYKLKSINHYDNANDFFEYLDYFYGGGIGNCFTWSKGYSEAYNATSYSVGNTTLTLKCWIDPKDVDWKETFYRNCYNLNYERELYISKADANIEVFAVILNGGSYINGQRVAGKSLINKPIIVHP